MSQPSLITEFKEFIGTVQQNPPASTADFLSYVQGQGIDLQKYTHDDLVELADFLDIDEEMREDFFEEVAGWL